MAWIETMKILCFLQHLSEVVHIPHTKMQKYTDIHDYLHITEGNYGNALVSEFSRRTDNFRSRFSYWPESAKTRTMTTELLGMLPGAVCQCTVGHWSCLGSSSGPWCDLHKHHRCAGKGSLLNHRQTYMTDRVALDFSVNCIKLEQKETSAFTFLICTARSSATDMYICIGLKHLVPVTFGDLVQFIAKVKLSSS